MVRHKNMAVIRHRHPIADLPPHHVGVFLATCALHVLAIAYVIDQDGVGRAAIVNPLQVSFVPLEKSEPPPEAEIPVLLEDAFFERPLIDIPAPSVEVAIPQEATKAIHAPPPAPPPEPAPVLDEGQGYGPLTKPRVISGPRSQDWYPRASVRRKESGRPVVKICISDTGQVESVELAKSSGYPRLDEAAVDIGWGYVFSPAMRGSKPVPVCLPYGIRFRIAIGRAGSR